jgi:hypothetical protein
MLQLPRKNLLVGEKIGDQLQDFDFAPVGVVKPGGIDELDHTIIK